MPLFDDSASGFDDPDVGFDSAADSGGGAGAGVSGLRLWTRGGRVIRNSAGKLVLCEECPCPAGTGTGTHLDDIIIEHCCGGVPRAVPARLYATFVPSFPGFCPTADNIGTIPIVNAGGSTWLSGAIPLVPEDTGTGTIQVDDRTISVEFGCDAGISTNFYMTAVIRGTTPTFGSLSCSFLNATLTSPIIIANAAVTCNPFVSVNFTATLDSDGIDSCANLLICSTFGTPYTLTFTVTVTP